MKIEARTVTPSEHVPHGIRYSLTLHEPYGKRILGYDNAHGIKPAKQGGFSGRRVLDHDHKHRDSTDEGVPYAFQDAHQLLADFFAEVDRVLRDIKSP
ncbi:MAG: DUF6516 family protein [Chromatiaceae bacterium]